MGQYTKDGGWEPEPDDLFFKALTAAEVHEFQSYAVENDAPADISVCHPVCQDIWVRFADPEPVDTYSTDWDDELRQLIGEK